MLIQRIVGVLCCLALCGCLWQPPRYVLPQQVTMRVIQAKDYDVPRPYVSLRGPAVDVHFVFNESDSKFAEDVYTRLNQRQFLRPVTNGAKTIFTVTVGKIGIEFRDERVKTELLYFEFENVDLLMQFKRHHVSYMIRAYCEFSVKKNGKIVSKGLFEGLVPDGMIFCDNFDEYDSLPTVSEPIYTWRGMKKLCSSMDSSTESSVIVQKTAEIFAGDMEELIVGLKKNN